MMNRLAIHHLSSIVKLLLVPFQRAFAQYVVKTEQKHGHEDQHGEEAIRPHRPEIDRIGIKEDDFHVEEHEQDGGHEVFDRHRHAGIALRFDATFEILILFFAVPSRPQQWHYDQYQGNKAQGD